MTSDKISSVIGGVGVILAITLFFGIVSTMETAKDKLPAYRLTTDGTHYFVQSRVFFHYCTEIETTNKALAEYAFHDMVSKYNAYAHPATLTVLETSTNR